MRTARGFVLGFIVAMAIGGVAGATPAIMHAVSHKVPTPTTATNQQPKPTTNSGDRQETSDEGSTSGTGVTGLDNAIAHVSANLAAHPNKGLANALSHLQANKAKHEAHKSRG